MKPASDLSESAADLSASAIHTTHTSHGCTVSRPTTTHVPNPHKVNGKHAIVVFTMIGVFTWEVGQCAAAVAVFRDAQQ